MSSSVNCPGGLLYAVRPGQTLARIAQTFSVTVDQVLDANPGIDPRNLQVGQVICVPDVADRVCRRGNLRTVRPGDSLYRISQETGVLLDDLIEANYWLPDPSVIYVGEQICVPLEAAPEGCCIVMEPTEEGSGLNMGGVVLIEDFDEASRVTFTGVNLPDPDIYGNYNTYVGDLVFREIERLIMLDRCASPNQTIVWSGSRVVDVPALGANLVAIFPYNMNTDERGPDILRGWIMDCR